MKAALVPASSSTLEVLPAGTSASIFAIVGQPNSGSRPTARNCV